MIDIAAQRGELSDLCRRHHVRELAVFGSVARGEACPDSDIDLLVEFNPTARPGLLALGRLARELAAILGRRVDLIVKDGIKPRIREQVLSEAEVLLADR